MDITDEQQAIVASSARNLVVNAFAGTGKTTTLVAYAKARPSKRFTYLAFNRSIKEEAQRKFPSNVKCVTTHGLAYAPIGKRYAQKLGAPRPFQVAEALGIPVLQAGKALEVVNRWLVSSDPALHERHLIGTPYGDAEAGGLMDAAKRLWARMADVGDTAISMPHDGYLKLYQLSAPAIASDVILFDEAQDANPVTTSIVLSQAADKVVVGDAHQAIYSFRGATNAMAAFAGAEHLALTRSFRFGEGVAAIATALLGDWKGERHTIHGLGRHQTRFRVDMSGPHALLARTNGELFRSAVTAMQSGKPFAYVGGVEGYRLDSILDAYRLSAGRAYEIRDPWIRAFADFSAMKTYADQMDDRELKMLATLVEEFGRATPSLVDQIKARAVPPGKVKGDEIMLATAHKSKGLEFDSVVLLDDFAELDVRRNPDGEEEGPSPEEINILYVALTRAERCLALNASTVDWLERTGRKHLLRAARGSQEADGGAIRPFDGGNGGAHAAPASDEFLGGMLAALDILAASASLDEAARRVLAAGEGAQRLLRVAQGAGRPEWERAVRAAAYSAGQHESK